MKPRYMLAFKFKSGTALEVPYESLDLLVSDLESVDAQEDVVMKKVFDRETGWQQTCGPDRPLAPIVFHMMEVRRAK